MDKGPCRICHESRAEPEHRGTVMAELVRPCKCNAFVHRACLQGWKNVRANAATCEVCLADECVQETRVEHVTRRAVSQALEKATTTLILSTILLVLTSWCVSLMVNEHPRYIDPIDVYDVAKYAVELFCCAARAMALEKIFPLVLRQRHSKKKLKKQESFSAFVMAALVLEGWVYERVLCFLFGAYLAGRVMFLVGILTVPVTVCGLFAHRVKEELVVVTASTTTMPLDREAAVVHDEAHEN